MFYLTKVFETFKNNPLSWGLFFIVLTSTFVVSGQKEFIQKSINKSLEKEVENSYFYALISTKKNANRVRRKLVQLPGVKQVKFIPQKEVENKIKKILSGIDVDKNDPLLHFDGLKVSLTNDLPTRGIKLIRDYIKRFVGEGVILSSTQTPQKKGKASFFVEVLRSWGWEIILSVLSLITFIIFLVSSNTLRKDFYLLEEFTRKKFIGGKTYCLGVALFFFISLIVLVQMGSVFWPGPLVLFLLIQAVNLYNFTKVQWE